MVRSERRLSLGAARNLGLQRVQTPYVLFWDADDTMLPRTLLFLEAAIEADPRLAAFGAAILEASGGRHRWPRPWIARLTAARDAVRVGRLRVVAVSLDGRHDHADRAGPCGRWLLRRRERRGLVPGRVAGVARPDRVERTAGAHLQPRRPLRVGPAYDRAPPRRARAQRARAGLRRTAGIPGWVRAALPLVALMQLSAIAAHTVVARLRGARGYQSRAGSRRSGGAAHAAGPAQAAASGGSEPRRSRRCREQECRQQCGHKAEREDPPEPALV